MTERTSAARAALVALLVATSLAALPLAAAGEVGPAEGVEPAAIDDSAVAGPADATWTDDRPADPQTNETIGYVEGYWYDDELPVDDREEAVVDEDELDSVVYRSMARVEVIRNLTFEEPVETEVLTREAYEREEDVGVENLTDAEELHENVRHEALFMVDRETDAIEEIETLFEVGVAGFYDPEDERAVVIAEDPEAPELDEIVLGHEMAHALQDQHFDLQTFDRETQDQATAEGGLIEGDAVVVDTEYEQRCEAEWDCTIPVGTPPAPGEINWGIYFSFLQPYEDGPDFVEHLYEDGGWAAVDAAYAEPPATTSEVIRPEEYGEREPAEIDLEDRSSDRWTELDTHEVNRSTFGEATMATMFAAPGLEGTESVVDVEAFLELGPMGSIEAVDYDQPVTDGWAGDEFVTYVTEERSIEDSGYVWATEWRDESEAEAFHEGYLDLLGIHDAEPVDGHEDVYEIEEDFPGAYAVEHDGEAVTVVRAPSVDELEEIREGTLEENR